MTNVEKCGLFLILIGAESFRDGGWLGGLGTLLLIGGFIMLIWDTKDETSLREDAANAFCGCADPHFDISESCRVCGKPPRY